MSNFSVALSTGRAIIDIDQTAMQGVQDGSNWIKAGGALVAQGCPVTIELDAFAPPDRPWCVWAAGAVEHYGSLDTAKIAGEVACRDWLDKEQFRAPSAQRPNVPETLVPWWRSRKDKSGRYIRVTEPAAQEAPQPPAYEPKPGDIVMLKPLNAGVQSSRWAHSVVKLANADSLMLLVVDVQGAAASLDWFYVPLSRKNFRAEPVS